MKNAKSPKNYQKQLSYQVAYSRMQDALEHGYFLEAISLQESIISDRLISLLTYHGLLSPDDKNFKLEKIKLSNLINDSKIVIGEESELVKKLRAFNKKRNICVHMAVKSAPGKPSMHPIDYRELCEKTGLAGRALSDELNNVVKKKVREVKRAVSSKV